MKRYANPTQDYVLVAFEKPYESTLILPDRELVLDTSFSPTEHRNIKGKVLGVPGFLSDMTLRMKPPGEPKPKRQVTSEWIAQMNRYGQKVDRSWYSLAGYVPEYELLSDIRMNVRVGDLAYIDYTCLQPENLVEEEGERQVYKVRYDNIICVSRGTKTVFKGLLMKQEPKLEMVGGYTLALPEMQTEEEITYVVMNDQNEPVGLLTQAAPKPKYLRALLEHVDPANTLGLKPGQILFYMPNSDWSNKIGEKEYYAIHERDYLAILDTNTMKLLGDRVAIERKEAAEITSGGIIIPESAKEQTTEGTITHSGPDVRNKVLQAGVSVLFAKGAGVDIELDGQKLTILRESDIYLTV